MNGAREGVAAATACRGLAVPIARLAAPIARRGLAAPTACRGLAMPAVLALLLAGCQGLPPPAAAPGMPIDAFLDDLRAQLREVHWHLRGHDLGCEGAGPREVDLRDGTVTLAMSRVAQAEAGASLKLVAIPLGATAATPGASAETKRKHGEAVTLTLAVAGDAPLVDLDAIAPAQAPVARAVNAVVDGFVRASAGQPCMRLASLRVELVVDVTREAGGTFKVVVPAIALDAGASERDVNTLTLDWKKIESRALR